jgi:hypothetical protein
MAIDGRRGLVQSTGSPQPTSFIAGGGTKYLGPRLLEGALETPMPTSLQYPLERSRHLQHQWERLLQQLSRPTGSMGRTAAIDTKPPREPEDDDDDDEEEDDLEESRNQRSSESRMKMNEPRVWNSSAALGTQSSHPHLPWCVH